MSFFGLSAIAQQSVPLSLPLAPPGNVQPLTLPAHMQAFARPTMSPSGVEGGMQPIVMSPQEAGQLQFQTRAAFPEDVEVEATERNDPPTLEPCDQLWVHILDKPTARVYTFALSPGKKLKFDRLEIHTKSCYKTDPEHAPETLAFLEIYEQPVDGTELVEVFRNWMYASAPAVSAIDHPLYDVWILSPEESSTT